MEYFQRRAYIHSLHLNINSLLPKIDEICFKAKLSVSMIGISESKLDSSFLNSELDIEDYDLIRLDHLKPGVPCYIRKFLSYKHKLSFCSNIESIFIKNK